MDEATERALIARCQAGDLHAFDALLAPCRGRAYRLAFRMVGSQADADDVLPEALLRAFQGIPKFDGRSRFGTWLWRIVTNTATDHTRQTRRQATLARSYPEADPPASSAAEDPARVAAEHESMAAWMSAIDALPADQRTALVLVAMERMSYAQVAQIQQCPEGTVAWRVAQARRRLCERLGPHLAPDQGADHAV